MANTGNQLLDSDELLHIALEASKNQRHEEAISSLKRAADLSPNDARVHYLLGAEHAQIGLYDRAAAEMQRAVELDPNLDTASFQLGLLHVTAGRVDDAANAWKLLDKLGSEHPLNLFKTGLLHLVKDQFAECEDCLRRGIATNRSNPALNADMSRILKDVENRAPAGAATDTGARPKAGTSKHVLLSAYKQNRTDDKDS
jgi:Flp pilus assembly protein TadD